MKERIHLFEFNPETLSWCECVKCGGFYSSINDGKIDNKKQFICNTCYNE